MKRVRQLNVFALVLIALVLTAGSAVAKVNYSNGDNHAYPNITMVDGPGMMLAPGYIMASTRVNSSNVRIPTLTRVDDNGGVLWQHDFTDTSIPNARLTHVEQVDNYGQVAFLVTGSAEVSGMSHAFLAMVDEMGTFMQGTTFDLGNSSLGLNCIQATDGTFVLVGVNYDTALDPTNPKEGFFIKVDPNLNILSELVFDSPTTSTGDDYDFAENVIETDTPERFFITGMLNNPIGSGPSALAMLVMSTPGTATMLWDKSFETTPPPDPQHGGHWDIGADAHFDGQNIWLLANNSIRHMPNITKFNMVGNILVHRDIDVGAPGSYEFYGFELMESNRTAGDLVIAGWNRYYDGSLLLINAFLMEYSTTMNQIVSQRSYILDNPPYASYVEDQWLAPFDNKQMPYFTPSIACHRPSSLGGYAVAGIEGSSPYDLVLLGANQALNIPSGCNQYTPTAFTFSMVRAASTGMMPQPIPVMANPVMLNDNSLSPIVVQYCAPNLKRAVAATEEAAIEAIDFTVYPVPAQDRLTLELSSFSEEPVTIRLINALGVLVHERNEAALNATQLELDLTGIAAGHYNLVITQGSERVFKHIVVID